MRVCIQRVLEAEVRVAERSVARMGKGLLVLLGIGGEDEASDVAWLASKVRRLRLFEDEEGKMNRSVIDVGGEIVVISQFTLYASTRKGARPSWGRAAPPSMAEPLYEQFCECMQQEIGRSIGRGEFGADMQISLINDGPVTIWIDSRQRE